MKTADMREWTIYLEPCEEDGLQVSLRVGEHKWGIATPAGWSKDNREHLMKTMNRTAGAVKELGTDYVLMQDGIFPDGNSTDLSKLPKDYWDKMCDTTPLDLPVIEL